MVPEIPPPARATNTYGTVVLQAVIGTDGRAHDLSYISGPQPLVQAAMEAFDGTNTIFLSSTWSLIELKK